MDPKIFCISRPQFDYEAVRKFIDEQSTTWRRTKGAAPGEELVEIAGRICYMSFGPNQSGRTTAEYIANLIVSGHDSVLEHASWTFLIVGVSRAFTHQLVRHRVGFSFSQLSQQYHDERGAQFIQPREVARSPRAAAVWARHVEASICAYAEILDILEKESSAPYEARKERNRALRSAARSVLPNATETKIAVSANARALRHFLNVRGSIIGDVEMRKVSVGLLRIVKADAPALFADFFIEALTDGSAQVVRREECLQPVGRP